MWQLVIVNIPQLSQYPITAVQARYINQSPRDSRTSASRLRRKRVEEEQADWAAMTESVGVMKNADRAAVFEEMKSYNRDVVIGWIVDFF